MAPGGENTTMQVTNITARFMRKVQVKDFEPMESEVSMSAHLEEGEDAMAAGEVLVMQAKTLVITALSAKVAGKNTASVTSDPAKAAAESPLPGDKKGPGRPPGTGKNQKAQAAQQAAANSGSDIPGDDKPTAASDIPGDEQKPNISANPENRVDPNDAGGDIPGDDKPAATTVGDLPEDDEFAAAVKEADASAKMTAEELQRFITSAITGKKITVEQAKKVLADAGYARTTEVPDEKRAEVKAKVEALFPQAA